jgi:hypothetical protein
MQHAHSTRHLDSLCPTAPSTRQPSFAPLRNAGIACATAKPAFPTLIREGFVAQEPSRAEPLGMGALFGAMAVFVLLGSPLVFLIWETVNDLLTGHIVGLHLALAGPALVVLLILFRFLGRSIARWDARMHGPASGGFVDTNRR